MGLTRGPGSYGTRPVDQFAPKQSPGHASMGLDGSWGGEQVGSNAGVPGGHAGLGPGWRRAGAGRWRFGWQLAVRRSPVRTRTPSLLLSGELGRLIQL